MRWRRVSWCGRSTCPFRRPGRAATCARSARARHRPSARWPWVRRRIVQRGAAGEGSHRPCKRCARAHPLPRDRGLTRRADALGSSPAGSGGGGAGARFWRRLHRSTTSVRPAVTRAAVAGNLLTEFLSELAGPPLSAAERVCCPLMLTSLDRFNALSSQDAEAALLALCGSARWARTLVAQRPFADFDHLCHRATNLWFLLDEHDWLQAFAPASAHRRKQTGRDGLPQSLYARAAGRAPDTGSRRRGAAGG